ncbi:phage protein [Pseudomonas phage PA02]|nr:phage protein [Pseudomonas phage PA02]BDR27024.1 hypothetical protein RVBP20_2650 [Pseudomonas phage sp. NK1]
MIMFKYLKNVIDSFNKPKKVDTLEQKIADLNDKYIRENVDVDKIDILSGYFTGMLSGKLHDRSLAWGYYTKETKTWMIYFVEQNFDSFMYKVTNNSLDIINLTDIEDLKLFYFSNEQYLPLNTPINSDLNVAVIFTSKSLTKDFIDPSLIDQVKSVNSNYKIVMDGLSDNSKFDSNPITLIVESYEADGDIVVVELTNGTTVAINRKLLNMFMYQSRIVDTCNNSKVLIDFNGRLKFTPMENHLGGINSAMHYWSSNGIIKIRCDYSITLNLDKFPEIVNHIGNWIHIEAKTIAKVIDSVVVPYLTNGELSTLIVDLDNVDIQYRGLTLSGNISLRDRLDKCKIKLINPSTDPYEIPSLNGKRDVHGFYRVDGSLLK